MKIQFVTVNQNSFDKGEWTKELIYINEFEKRGYHRQAKIETIKSN